MKKLLLALPIVLGLLSTSTAFASGKPERVYSPLPESFVASGNCPFDVGVNVIRTNEYTTSFFDSSGQVTRQIITGALVVSLTNLSNGNSITVKIPGPGVITFNPDGSFVQKYEGRAAIPLPHALWLTSGRVDVKYFPNADPIVLRSSGNRQDACAILA